MMPPRRQPTEPEIIPPGQEPADLRGGRPDPWTHFSVHGTGTHRVYVRRIGPVGILLVAALIGTLAALVFVMLIGAFFIAIPVAALLLVAAIVGGLMRRFLR
jgi:hypothetical protein